MDSRRFATGFPRHFPVRAGLVAVAALTLGACASDIDRETVDRAAATHADSAAHEHEAATAKVAVTHDHGDAQPTPSTDAGTSTQAPAHDHAQHGSEPLVRRMELDGGRKWPTDAPLRAGMARIHAAFEADHAEIHAGTQTDAAYAALASNIQREVDGIVAQCRLPPAADAQLHYVIADMLQGIAWMRGEDPARTRHHGAALVHGALRAYQRHFDAATPQGSAT